MGKSIPEEIINQIPILYKKYGVKRKVADELNISTATVNRYLLLFEAGMPKKTLEKEELVKQINEEYERIPNLSLVSRKLGICSTTVKKYLTEENKNRIKKETDDKDALWYYIFRLFGLNSEEEPVSKWNLVQMQKFKNQGISYKEQLLTLKYFYEVQHHSTKKSNGSIGIIPFIHQESMSYYRNQLRKVNNIDMAIQKQLEQDRIEIPYQPNYKMGKNKKKKCIDLNAIGE